MEGELWRTVSASLSHISPIHLLFNVTSLWKVGRAMEPFLGAYFIAKYSLILLVGSMIVFMGIVHVGVTRWGKSHWATQPAVGYSCVVFGWMSIAAQLSSTTSITIGSVTLPLNLAPFASLAFTTLILRQTLGMIGHLAGILIGFAISWGGFVWITPYWTGVMYFWFIVGTVASLKSTGPFRMEWIEVLAVEDGDDDPGWGRDDSTRRVMRNGSIVRV